MIGNPDVHRFRDRTEAGRKLAAELGSYALQRPIVLGLPRGGVPVAYEIARALGAPLDVWVVRKVGVPWHPELGVGAVAEGGYVYLSSDVLAHVRLDEDELIELTERKREEVAERVRRFRGGQQRPELRDRSVILVDDGIATGGTVRAAIQSIRVQAPAQLILAVPVAAPSTLRALEREVDEAVCLLTPANLYAIGIWYEDFTQVSDVEVIRLLQRARPEQPRPEGAPPP